MGVVSVCDGVGEAEPVEFDGGGEGGGDGGVEVCVPGGFGGWDGEAEVGVKGDGEGFVGIFVSPDVSGESEGGVGPSEFVFSVASAGFAHPLAEAGFGVNADVDDGDGVECVDGEEESRTNFSGVFVFCECTETEVEADVGTDAP